MTQVEIKAEMSRLLTEITSLENRYRLSLDNNGSFDELKQVRFAIKAIYVRLEQLERKLGEIRSSGELPG